jgi:hypothetical protein
MMVPGAYFRDETIWRGRMIEFACDLKATLYELGLVSCTSRLSCNWKGYQWPWAWAYALRCFLAIFKKCGEESGRSGKLAATSTKRIALSR